MWWDFGAGRAGFTAVTFASWLDCPSLVLVRGNDFDQDWFDPARGFWIKQAMTRATLVGVVAPDLSKRIQALFPGGFPQIYSQRNKPSGLGLAASG